MRARVWPDLPRSRRYLRSPLPGCGACDLSENRPGHQAGAARIVEIEQPADQLARRVQASDCLSVGVDHAARGIDLQPAESKSDTASHGVGLEWRFFDCVGPVRFVDG